MRCISDRKELPAFYPGEVLVKRLSVREVRQALIGKGNLRNLLSDRINSWDPYRTDTLDFFRSVYDQEALKGWNRTLHLFQGLTPIHTLENTWSVLGHFTELANFLTRGIELYKDSKTFSKVKSLNNLSGDRSEKDPFDFLLSKQESFFSPDLLGISGFNTEVRIRWGLANRIKFQNDIPDLIRSASTVEGLGPKEISLLLQEAIVKSNSKNLRKVNKKIATQFTKSEFEIFSSDLNLINDIYQNAPSNRDQLVNQLQLLNGKYHADSKQIEKLLTSLSKRDWMTAGQIAEQIEIDSTTKIASADLIKNANSINDLTSIRSFNPWQPMSENGYNQIIQLLPKKSHKYYWKLSAKTIADELINNTIEEKSLSLADLKQLFISWNDAVQQGLISAEKFHSLPVDAAVWKKQSFEVLIKAAVSRATDGKDLLYQHISGVPEPKALLECILKLNSVRAKSLSKEIIDYKLIRYRHSKLETKYPCNWEEYLAQEIGSKQWELAIEKSLLEKPTWHQVLFASESKYKNTKLKSFQNEVVKLLLSTKIFELDIATRLTKWFERDATCLKYIAPKLSGKQIESLTSLSEKDCSFESIELLYQASSQEHKEKLWQFQLELVVNANDLNNLFIEGAKYGFVFDWNHRWKQVSGNVETRARALALATRFDPSRFKKIKFDFTEDAMAAALQWGAKQLPREKSHEIAYMELTSLIGSRHAETLHWLLRQRNFQSPSGSKLQHLYKQHEILKKSGKLRTISAPSAGLKRIQKAILLKLLNPLGAHEAAYGFVNGRSIVGNATLHVGRKVVVNADVSNCFPSVKWQLVLASLRRDFSTQLSNHSISAISDICTNDGGLPIGAPSSPALLNRVLVKTDEILTTQAEIRDCKYSRYADDLTFSGDENAVQLLGIAKSVLGKIDLQLDPLKTNIFRRGRRQICTGLVVNDKVNVPRAIRRRIRASVHSFEIGKQLHWEGNPVGQSSLTGRLNFLKMVSPQHASVLIQRFDDATKKRIVKTKKSLAKKAK